MDNSERRPVAEISPETGSELAGLKLMSYCRKPDRSGALPVRSLPTALDMSRHQVSVRVCTSHHPLVPGRCHFHPCNRVIGTDRGIWSTSSPVVPRVAARSNVTLNVTLPGHTPFAGAVTRNSTVVTERVEGDAVQTELQVESEATVQQVCARSDPPRRIASHSRITAYLRAPMDGASRAGSLNGLDRTEHGRPLPSRPGGAPTIPRHIPGRP